MIFKLFRYDFKGVGKKLLPLYIMALLLSVINRISMENTFSWNFDYAMPLWASMLQGLFIGAYFITIVAIFVVTFFILVAKYNRSIYGDEGYLTNTLPISQDKIIWAKALNFFVWQLIGGLVAFGTLAILFVSNFLLEIPFAEIWAEISNVIQLMSGSDIAGIVLIVIAGFIGIFQSIFMVFLCVGIGNQFQYKLVAGVVGYMVISMITSIVSNLLGSNITETFMNYSVGAGTYNLLSVGGWVFGMTLVWTIAFYFGTRYLQMNKLNLD